MVVSKSVFGAEGFVDDLSSSHSSQDGGYREKIAHTGRPKLKAVFTEQTEMRQRQTPTRSSGRPSSVLVD